MCFDDAKFLIVSLGSIAGSITAVIGVFKLIALPIRNKIRDEKRFREDITSSISILEKHSEENYISTLRLTIVNEDMPLSERIAAGDKYVALGGNGAVKKKYKELIDKLGNEGDEERK